MPEFNDFLTGGYLLDTLPDHLFSFIRAQAFDAKRNKCPHNEYLAGNIREEYAIPVVDNSCFREFERFVLDKVEEYDEKYNYLSTIMVLNRDVPYGLGNPMWVNFQKKHEFNPIHTHSGIYSFVIWVQIPYDIENELKNSPGVESNTNLASMFQFYCSDFLGNIHTPQLKVDKSFEGKILLFPAKLNHSVYPFYTSDDYRISVSGNVFLNV